MSTFREQLILAQLASRAQKVIGPLSQNEGEAILSNAQAIATQCCAAWTHAWNDREPNGVPAKGARCTRCGVRS